MAGGQFRAIRPEPPSFLELPLPGNVRYIMRINPVVYPKRFAHFDYLVENRPSPLVYLTSYARANPGTSYGDAHIAAANLWEMVAVANRHGA